MEQDVQSSERAGEERERGGERANSSDPPLTDLWGRRGPWLEEEEEEEEEVTGCRVEQAGERERDVAFLRRRPLPPGWSWRAGPGHAPA